MHICWLPEASPQQSLRGAEEEPETLPASDSQVQESIKGSPTNAAVQDGSHVLTTPAPTSPASSLPSSASKAADDVLWMDLILCRTTLPS